MALSIPALPKFFDACLKGLARGLNPNPYAYRLVLLVVWAFAMQALNPVHAADGDARVVFGVVSERSAAEVVAATERIHRHHPDVELILRSPEQLAEKTDDEVMQLWNTADALLFVAVFGDQALRLADLLEESPPASEAQILAFHSDLTLTRESRLDGRKVLQDVDMETYRQLTRGDEPGKDPMQRLREQQEAFPTHADWLEAREYWRHRGADNKASLLAWLLRKTGYPIEVPEPDVHGLIRYYQKGALHEPKELRFPDAGGIVAILDLDSSDRAGDRDLHDALERALEKQGLSSVSIFARWGLPTVNAVEELDRVLDTDRLAGIVMLQDFVAGGGDGREAMTTQFVEHNVPVIKGIRFSGRTEDEWRLSEDGIPWDSLHYQVAMPEVQGTGQPHVLAAADTPQISEVSGLRYRTTHPLATQVGRVAERLMRWDRLRHVDNGEKKVAVIYYNHPPGRHNVGADNLDVPDSLWQILQRMKAEGYTTGPLPETPEQLLDIIMERGINLPEDRSALEEMAEKVNTWAPDAYRQWFEKMPPALQAEVAAGPLGYLHESLYAAIAAGESHLAQDLLSRHGNSLRHILEGVRHPARERALKLFDQLLSQYESAIGGAADWDEAETLVAALRRTGIEGMRGWGDLPGEVMVHEDQFLFPGIQFGNVFLGPQPPRGWEIDEELLHANLSFPPPHQYLAFYFWLQNAFEADALVHVGRHSTYEFLPRRRAGLTEEDYPLWIGGNLPGVYPYIVDGVGEGIQAKRRGLAVMVDHLTPPLEVTPLYDDLLRIRELVETYQAGEGSPDTATRSRTVEQLRETIKSRNLQDEILDHGHHHGHDHPDEHSHAHEHHDEDVDPASDHDHEHAHDPDSEPHHEVEGLSFEEVSDELLIHEAGHFITRLQEQFMPYGLHVFGKPWEEEAVEKMLVSMSGDDDPDPETRRNLVISPDNEMDALIRGLAGGFVEPGPGNDPIRTPSSLPTGRNFHALSGEVMPTRVAYELGAEMAGEARRLGESTPGGSEAVVLWASETVRDNGVMVAFGMDMLGIRPKWNSRGIVQSLERIPLEDDRVRRDVLFTSSGLFRDLYGNLLVWLDRAVLLALDGSSETIIETEPELVPALMAALEPLGEHRDPGGESLERNEVAASWVESVKSEMDTTEDSLEIIGRLASHRIFGTPPGGYGAGVNRLVERSGSWDDRMELAGTYMRRMGHVYGEGKDGANAQRSFRNSLSRVENAYHGRATNLYGLLDNNDGFDYLGGLSMAVEQVRGESPDNRIVFHADPENPYVDSLHAALTRELRGRYLNPHWIEPLMGHGYSGARTMGSKFLENLWGWQVTNPRIIRSWMWDDVKDVYFDDRHGLGLDSFLEDNHNAHVKANMTAIFLVAADKDFWDADEDTMQELSEQFAKLVIENGLPGSGHTRPDHPVMDSIRERLSPDLQQAFADVLDRAHRPAESADPVLTRATELTQETQVVEDAMEAETEAVQEIEMEQDAAMRAREDGGDTAESFSAWRVYGIVVLLLVLMAAGLLRGARTTR